tara:strand:- start:135 stop:389 length:255 start_codon:yes stop_codon:yes gene_type:complete
LLQPHGPLSWHQVLDWLALYDEQPWGDQRDDLRAFAAATISIAPHLERNAKLPEPEFPYWDTGTTSPADALQRMREFDERWQKS